MAGNEITPSGAVDAAGNAVAAQTRLGDGTGPLAPAPVTPAETKLAETGAEKSAFAKAIADADAEHAKAKAAADKDAATQTPEQKAQADKDAAEKAAKVTAAEKAVADAKTPEEKAAAQKALDALKGTAKPEGAPEKYEAFKLPDGMKLDEAALKEFEPVAKELNLTQDQAQKLVDLDAKRESARMASQVQAFNKFMDGELATLKADPEIGGQNYDQSISNARVAIKAFGTPALQKYLDVNPAGNNVEVVRLLATLGKMVREDKFISGGKPASAEPKSLADRLFPTTAQK